ncbi:MAG: hypothetical protein JWN48_4023 [Myxococcaceae bacterium]|nr:hypothetical protein [Myxococcaceae bacterium]
MMRRLHQDELARAPAALLNESGFGSLCAPERERAALVLHALAPFLRDELALTPAQTDDLALALERALVLSLRAAP